MNREWHLRHRMPKNPTLDQRRKWHLAHARHCGCRPIPRRWLRKWGLPPHPRKES
ncbi:MAG TPA: hypothetical protein VMV05_00915 [bacterium]|nr:hypothetical protein [bacterium]